jgi:hypothetical protein
MAPIIASPIDFSFLGNQPWFLHRGVDNRAPKNIVRCVRHQNCALSTNRLYVFCVLNGGVNLSKEHKWKEAPLMPFNNVD